MPTEATDPRPRQKLMSKFMFNKIISTMSAAGVVLFLLSGGAVAFSPYLPDGAEPKGCEIETDSGINPKSEKPQKFRVARGHCGEGQTAWLFMMPSDAKSGSVVLVDSLPLVYLKKGEDFVLAECSVGGKKVVENIFAHGKWAKGAYDVKAGAGLIRAWVPNAERTKFVEMPIAGMKCSRDLP
jgi:hypothetical protein